MPLSVTDFIARWRASTLTERSASQSHFRDLCEVLGQPFPAEVDQSGSFYTFEKGVAKAGGGEGFADVWFKGHFAWEYKGPRKDLKAAYQQLLQYREDLENPPLLVVSDLNRFEVHTNFTGTATRVYSFDLAGLGDPSPLPGAPFSAIEVLRALFAGPEKLRPEQTPAQVTEAAAKEFASLAESLRRAGAEPQQSAHFLMRLLFCLFAEDIGLLPPKLFTNLVEATRTRPDAFTERLSALFQAMASGGFFGFADIAHFNGGLFADSRTLPLCKGDMEVLSRACRLDWATVEPAIFGTLFERSLDPSKRAQTGAHYTSRDDIMLIVEPVLMAPLRRQWAEVQEQAKQITAKRAAGTFMSRKRHDQALEKLLTGFTDVIAGIRVLDPACGSGNFLYVALKQMLDLEKEVITFAALSGMSRFFPKVGPQQLYGIEINAYAHELAQVVVWIGYIQWLHDNGFSLAADPILRPLENIRLMDAILARDDQGRPVEPAWPEANVIIGNPPFLGGKRLRSELGDKYVDDLFALYKARVPREADLVCYWFEKAHAMIETGEAKRAGLLATNSIRGGANRHVLEKIKQTGDIFWAQSDRDWILEGAAVNVSMVGFDNGTETSRALDGLATKRINTDLTGSLDLTGACRLTENAGIAFQGPVVVGPFDVDPSTAGALILQPNPHGQSNAEVIFPVANAADLTSHSRCWFIIDFAKRSLEEASLYEAPFEYVKLHVKPVRENNRDRQRRRFWWRHGRAGTELRDALNGKSRQIASPRVSKHRVFLWLSADTVVTDAVIAFAREDDYFFGVLHSRPHERWALRQGTSLEDRPRYTPTTCFETFPFPWPPGQEPVDDPRVQAIAAAAKELVEKRDAWLNPLGAGEAELKKRTLTNLYNLRPTWLDLAHRKLDGAVLDAYGWPRDLGDEEILERLLALNLERAGKGESERYQKRLGNCRKDGNGVYYLTGSV